MTEDAGRVLTERLRLEPVREDRAADLWMVVGDDAVWPWYGGARPAYAQAVETARAMGEGWRWHGVHKWIAYERKSGEVVGRGGLSRTPVDDDWGQLYAFLPDEPWVRAAHPSERPYRAHADWLELGWAVRGKFQHRGWATEIGRAGLAYAFEVLRARAVVSCTLRHNVSSRAVMARLGMRAAGEIVSGGDPYAVSVLAADAGPRPDRSRG